MKRQFSAFLPLILILLFHFGVRSQNLTRQEPYIDEGFHAARAAVIWDFEAHPARFSHGKLLVYFWLGIFESSPPNFLLTSRMGMAIFSLISAATLYILGKMLYNHRAGLIAMGLYAVMPMAVFFERMGMADPFAAGFVALLAWRSLIFARRPTLGQGMIIGVLIALATMAKLTTGLTPALPILAALLAWPWRVPHGIIQQIMALFYDTLAFIRTYLPGLMVAALTVIALWLPILIPAWIAESSDEPFIVVNAYNVERPPDISLHDYLYSINFEMEDFFSRPLWITVMILPAFLLITQKRLRKPIIYLMGWLLILAALSATTAHLISSRYYMPLTAPIALLIGVILAGWWEKNQFLALLGGFGIQVWLLLFVLPFIHTDITAPKALPLARANDIEYLDGVLTGEIGAQHAAAYVNTLPHDFAVYISWDVCHLMFFFIEREFTCVSQDNVTTQFRRVLQAELQPDQSAYLVISGYRNPEVIPAGVRGLEFEQVNEIPRQTVRSRRSITFWRVKWAS